MNTRKKWKKKGKIISEMKTKLHGAQRIHLQEKWLRAPKTAEKKPREWKWGKEKSKKY